MVFEHYRRSFFALAFLAFLTIVYVALNAGHFFENCERNGDFALISLETEKAQRFESFVGPYSRFKFHHPGPFYFYYYAAAQKVLPTSDVPLGRYNTAQLFLNILFIGVAVWKVSRRGAGFIRAILLIAVTLFVFYQATDDVLHSVWGPATMLAPMLCFLITSASILQGRFHYAWAFLISATAMTQNHLGSVAVVLPVGIFALARGVMARRKQRLDLETAERVSILVGITIAIFSYMLPIYQALTSEGFGNLGRIFSFVTRHNSTHGFFEALQFVSSFSAISLRMGFLSAPFILVMLLLIGFLFSRLADRDERALFSVCFVALLFSIIGATSIHGAFERYLMWFVYAVIAALIFCIKSSFVTYFLNRRALLVLVAILAGCFSLHSILRLYRLQSVECGNRVDVVMSDLSARPNVRYEIKIKDNEVWKAAALVGLRLYRGRIPFCVEKRWEFMFGESLGCRNIVPGPEEPMGLVFRRIRKNSPEMGSLRLQSAEIIFEKTSDHSGKSRG